jgi:hypothetical protein
MTKRTQLTFMHAQSVLLHKNKICSLKMWLYPAAKRWEVNAWHYSGQMLQSAAPYRIEDIQQRRREPNAAACMPQTCCYTNCSNTYSITMCINPATNRLKLIAVHKSAPFAASCWRQIAHKIFSNDEENPQDGIARPKRVVLPITTISAA